MHDARRALRELSEPTSPYRTDWSRSCAFAACAIERRSTPRRLCASVCLRPDKRLEKPSKSDFDADRPLRADEDLDLIFTGRVQRRVSMSLTLQHDRVRYLLPDTRMPGI